MNAQKKPWYKTENVIFILPILLLAFMHMEAWVTELTFYGQNTHAAGRGWFFLGIILEAAAAFVVYKGNDSRAGIKPGTIVLAGALMVLGLCAYAGFDFSIA